jgi:hypothetical protein
LEQKNIAIQASIRELVVEYGLTLPQKSINDAIAGLRSIGSALSSADVKEHSLRTELDQLRNQASENQKIKSTLETVLVEKTAQEALVNDLKKKLQDATSTTQHQIQNSESENVITGTTTSRMSFARSATSTSRLPPKLPPPSMPPPPLPSTPMLPEGLPPANQALPFLAKLIKPEFEISQARPTSPNDATDPPPVDQVTDSNEKALQSQIVQHKAAMEEATKELTTLQTMLRKVSVYPLDTCSQTFINYDSIYRKTSSCRRSQRIFIQQNEPVRSIVGTANCISLRRDVFPIIQSEKYACNLKRTSANESTLNWKYNAYKANWTPFEAK